MTAKRKKQSPFCNLQSAICNLQSLNLLFLADTHLGFDLPRRPRVERRRRGHDFFANYQRVLDAAVHDRVDAVVHGGDLLFRSRVPPELVQQAILPLKRVADAGIPVILVPGNHERSHIPHGGLAYHPRLFIFDRPRTFVVEGHGMQMAFAGFPYHRKDVRTAFRGLVDQTGWRDVLADVHVLCIHHCFEGATVGPGNYTFRYASDVVRASDVPPGFAAVLSGHIHRHQVLTLDLRGRALAAPVLYPGSIERTSFAEKDEPKGYMRLQFRGGPSGGSLTRWEFHDLPARPMVVEELHLDDVGPEEAERRVRNVVDRADPDAVLRLRLHGTVGARARSVLSAASLRRLAPATMNVEVTLVDERPRKEKNV